MDTLNDQLQALECQPGAQVVHYHWAAVVYRNQFGLGVEIRSGNLVGARCDGSLPAIKGIYLWKDHLGNRSVEMSQHDPWTGKGHMHPARQGIPARVSKGKKPDESDDLPPALEESDLEDSD